MVRTRVVLGLVLLGGSIVVPGKQPVNQSSIGNGQATKQWSDGSPMPIPKPKGDGGLMADGSPMPIPKPKDGGSVVADGSPMPIPKPKPTGAIEQFA